MIERVEPDPEDMDPDAPKEAYWDVTDYDNGLYFDLPGWMNEKSAREVATNMIALAVKHAKASQKTAWEEGRTFERERMTYGIRAVLGTLTKQEKQAENPYADQNSDD